MLSNTSCNSSSDSQNGDKKSLTERLKTLCSDLKPELPPIESAMCYDVAAPTVELGPCIECGKEIIDFPYLKNNIDERIPSLARYGYEATTSCVCDTCVKKMLQEKRIVSDQEGDETTYEEHSYVILNIKREGDEASRQIIITNESTVTDFISCLKKQKKEDEGNENITEDEKTAYQLLTGKNL